MATRRYISVILPLRLEWEPYYALPETSTPLVGEKVRERDTPLVGEKVPETDSLLVVEKVRETDTPLVGERVKVVFAGKQYIGVVSGTDVEPKINESRILEIISVERSLERITHEEIALWRMIAEYYMCSVGEVYKMAYPHVKTNREVARAAALQRTLDGHEKILVAMKGKIARLKDRLEKNQNRLASAKEGTKKRTDILAAIEKAAQEIAAAEEALMLAEKRHESISIDSLHWHHAGNEAQEHKMELTEAQLEAYTHIKESVRKGKPALLHGITGSGKTEIYIRMAEETFRQGKNVLYLVPEIALSRQLTERLEKHFGDSLITFHSAETEASKRNTAEKIRAAGRTASRLNYIVLGTRSSLFLPHNNLGLVIIDEEHDNSYKQNSPAPRYNGRDTAFMLSLIHRCGVILGSATPSLEELYNCECGRHTLVTLNERYHGAENSEIEIIDTKAERRKRGMVGNFSRKLIDHIKNTIAAGGQVMLLRNRRSWAPALQCEECGEIPKCPHCNVSLSLHKTGASDYMACHYCGYRRAYSPACTRCNGNMFSLGAGTQKIEEEAAALFPEARIARLDGDIAQNKREEARIIKNFSEGCIDILIGTQIISKGFDFSNLRLTAMIAADTMLGLQDFRADEKAIQLFEQFRGRSGRRGEKGRFIIQTAHPEHPIYQRLAKGEADVFCNGLLMERKVFGFPPYTRIIEITIKDKFKDRAERMASALACTLRKVLPDDRLKGLLAGKSVTDPYEPAVDRVMDEHIRRLRISLQKDRNLKANKIKIAETIEEFEKHRKYDGHIMINVDPA